MTKQDVRALLDLMVKNQDPNNYVNYSLGDMHKQERVFLSKHKAIKTVRLNDEVYDIILDKDIFALYWNFKREAEKDKKAARLSGIDELARR